MVPSNRFPEQLMRQLKTLFALGRQDTPPPRLLVAVSGGMDSMVLLTVLGQIASRYPLQLVAGHVHHGLRGEEADGDAALVQHWAAYLGVSCTVCHLSEAEIQQMKTGNLEEEARYLRYRALAAMAAEVGCHAICTAHTRDDQAETVLHRIARSTGWAGLCGILPRREEGTVPIIRPLLIFGRDTIEAYARAEGVPSRMDSMNLDPSFTRVRIRKEILPYLRETLNPALDKALAHLADLAQEEEQYWQNHLAFLLSRLGPASRVEPCPRSDFLRLTRAEQRRLLRHCCGRGMSEPSFPQIEAMLGLIGGTKPQGEIHLTSSWYLYRRYEVFFFAPPMPPGRPLLQRNLTIPGETWIAEWGWRITARFLSRAEYENHKNAPDSLFLPADALGDLVWIRSRRAGDIMSPAGMQGRKKVKKILQELEISFEARERVPVIGRGDTILALAGLCISREGMVREDTQRILWLQWE